ncbi:MAG: Gfo/Idh/MocA family oxidoreductase [Planctomycetia bacterium]|nr:Gfo/Idh/MocA family oxidoreductase [Planctomycetia bacterium]
MTLLTRRKFLKQTLSGTAVISLPLLVSAKALGLDGGTPANDRIVMGMVGQGIQGRIDTQGFLCYPQCQIVTVCDAVDKHAEMAASLVNKAYANSDCKTTWMFEDVLNDEKIDAVFIGTNEHWHTYIAVHAMRNGKDVYCEKPETLTIREGQLLRETARHCKRVFSGGSQRVVADYQTMHKIIRAGLIGKVLIGHGNAGCYWGANDPLPGQPVPDGVHWDRWLGPAPVRPFHPGYLSCGCGNGYMDFSGGGLVSWGAHCWGAIMYAMHLDYTGPTKITPPGVNGEQCLTWEFANGMKIMEGNAWGQHAGLRKGLPPGGGFISFTGELGTVSEQDIFNEKYPLPDMELEVFKGEPASKSSEHDPVGIGGTLYYAGRPTIFGDFLHCVKTREVPFRNVERAHRVCSLAHLGNIALHLRRELHFDPVKEEIIGDETAARMLDRPRRSPWILDT